MIDFNIWFNPINDAMDQIDFLGAYNALRALNRIDIYDDDFDYRDMQIQVREDVVKCISILYTEDCNDSVIQGVWHISAHRDDEKKHYWVDICLPIESTMPPVFTD